MKQVLNTLRNLSLNRPDELLQHVNRELGPVVKELRRRFNERHGEFVQVSADYTATVKDEFIEVDASAGPVAITLLPAADAACWVTVCKVDATVNAVVTGSADQINGVDSFSTVVQYATITFVSNGTTYRVQSEYP